jgi:hypothetical protein
MHKILMSHVSKLDSQQDGYMEESKGQKLSTKIAQKTLLFIHEKEERRLQLTRDGFYSRTSINKNGEKT